MKTEVSAERRAKDNAHVLMTKLPPREQHTPRAVRLKTAGAEHGKNMEARLAMCRYLVSADARMHNVIEVVASDIMWYLTVHNTKIDTLLHKTVLDMKLSMVDLAMYVAQNPDSIIDEEMRIRTLNIDDSTIYNRLGEAYKALNEAVPGFNPDRNDNPLNTHLRPVSRSGNFRILSPLNNGDVRYTAEQLYDMIYGQRKVDEKRRKAAMKLKAESYATTGFKIDNLPIAKC